MSTIITDLDDLIDYVNTLYNFSSTSPTSGEEDYTVWTALANIAVNTWEHDSGILWNELFVKLETGQGGDITTAADDTSSYVI